MLRLTLLLYFGLIVRSCIANILWCPCYKRDINIESKLLKSKVNPSNCGCFLPVSACAYLLMFHIIGWPDRTITLALNPPNDFKTRPNLFGDFSTGPICPACLSELLFLCRCISWYIMKNPDGYWNTFLSSLHFLIDHEVSWCTLKNHERSWWLLKQLWCIMNYYDVSWMPMGKSLSISWTIMKNHDRSWFATLHFREVACSLILFLHTIS